MKLKVLRDFPAPAAVVGEVPVAVAGEFAAVVLAREVPVAVVAPAAAAMNHPHPQ